MNTHSVELDGYYARSRGSSTIYLGTAGSHGNEQLQVTQGKGWEGLTVQVVFHPSKVAVQLPANGLLDVPWEATENPLTAMQGRIVFQGFDQDRLVNSTDLAYTVADHSPALGRDEEPYTPGIVEGVLNQMAADKDAILQAAQQTGQAKEAAAASATEAAGSAANAQQSVGAANTSAGQAAASASQAAGSAAAAGETLTQVQTAGQEAQQKVKNAETEALDKIATAAPALPAVSSDAAWQSVTVKPDGTGYNLAALAPIEAAICPTVSGNPAVCENSAAWGLQGLKIYGKSVQDGTPSPEDPVPIVSAGDSGSIELTVTGQNLVNFAEDQKLGAGNVSEQITIIGGQTLTITMSQTVVAFANNGMKSAQHWHKFKDKQGNVLNQGGVCPMNFSNVGDTRISTTVLTAPKDATQLELFANSYFGEKSLTLINHYVMVAYGDDTNVAYVPYQNLQHITFSTPNGLRGIPVDSGGNYTDANGQQWVCDDADFDTGKIYKNIIDLTFDGSSDENWSFQSGTNIGNRYYIVIKPTVMDSYSSNINSMNDILSLGRPDATYNNPYCYTITNDGSVSFLYVSLSGTESLEDLRSYLQTKPMRILARLKESMTIIISSKELAAYRALTTCADTTVVSTSEPVAGLEVGYVMNGNKYCESVNKRLAALEAMQTGI